MKTKISLIKCRSYESALVFENVQKAITLLGGISEFIKPKSRVLVKPNLLIAKPPELGITTHPEVVRAVIRLLKTIDCTLMLGDGPSVWGYQVENVNAVYEATGMKAMCAQEDVALVDFDKRRWRGKFPLTTWLDQCDYVVNVPKFKTHQLTVLTGAVKNLFGLVSGTYKTELHKNYFNRDDFSGIVVDIYNEIRPALTVVDGITALEGEGPGTTGKLRQAGVLLAGVDCVALDSILALLMGIRPLDATTTKNAALRHIGTHAVEDIEILGDRLTDCAGEPFLLPTASSLSQKLHPAVISLAKKLIRYYPCVERDHCIRCAGCIKACPTKAITMKKKGIVFDYSKCIACFCCQETCPAKAITIKKSLAAKIIGL
ncbi:MAG: DUF362 domain-containing protein [Candidatus Omnitrophota bacterium]|jgi:uncharacterized protein (DUF362 family)/NAD-dependent dihydropyrimidine dehydrogenase PreA subunit|nr:MAG: DUF362 domain-containing protein [Candidatus Omnitrophota bacterium]